MDKVLAFERQWRIDVMRQRIGKAVADVEPRPVAPVAEPAEGRDGDVGLTRRRRNDLKLEQVQEGLKVGSPSLSFAPFDDAGQFHPRDG